MSAPPIDHATGGDERAALDLTHPTGEGPVAAVRLTGALHTLSTLALATSGAALFATPIVMLILRRSVINPIDVATVIGLAVAWLACLAIPRLSTRAAIQTGIGIVFLASPLLLGNASGGPWMPVTLVGFAIVVGAVFTLARNSAFVIVLVVALVQAAVLRIAPVGAAFTDDSLTLVAGPMLTVLAGIGLVWAFADWRAQAIALDVREEELELAQESTEQRMWLQRAQETVERRIHETVLNTLTGISMGDADAQLTRRRAQRDLEQLELGVQPLGDTALSRIIDIALATSGAQDMVHEIRVTNDDVVPASIATALRDATVEALRNVVRHAQATHVRVHATFGDLIEIGIGDDGIGMSDDVVERFGLSSAIRRGIESIAGSVRINSQPGLGTTVTLQAPRVAAPPDVTPPTEATSLMDGSRGSRLGLLGTNVFLAIIVIPVALVLPATWVIVVGSAVYAAVNAVLAWQWTPVLRRWLPPVAVVAAVVVFAAPGVVSGSPLECSTDDATSWLIAAISGGGALLLLSAYRSLIARSLVVIVIGAASGVLVVSVDPTCREFPLLSLIVCITYMAAIAGFVTWIDVRFEAQRLRRMQLWRTIVVSQADLAGRQAATDQWNTLTASTRSLLEGLASGDLNPRDPLIRAEAETEGSSLRARLGRSRTTPLALVQLMETLLPVAKANGCAVDLTQITEWTRRDPCPHWLVGALCATASRGRAERIGLVVLHDEGVDELLVSCRKDAAAAFLDAVPEQKGECVITVESEHHAEEVLLSVRRPGT